MSKSIFEKQKDDKFINLHLAKDRFYIESEIFWKVGFWGSLVYGISLLIVYFIKFDFIVPTIEVIVGIGSLLFAEIFKRRSRKKKKQGARAQEEIDTQLFDLPWNDNLVPEREVNPDFVLQAAPKSKKDPKRFKEWYSVGTATSASYNAQVLKCQRENISFDYLLRKKFTSCLFWIMVWGIVLVLGCGLVIKEPTLVWLLNIVLPVSGFLYFVGTSWFDNSQTMKDHEKMEQAVRIKLQKLLKRKNSIDKTDLREIQDFIYRTREGKTIIPNSFYEKYRDELDNLIISGTKLLNKNIAS